VADERQRGGEQRCAADPLERAGDIERSCAPCEPAEKRGSGEENNASDEDQPPPVPVGEGAGREDQSRERQRVGVHDPLQAGEARVEPLLDVRQRDDHHRDVEEEHERRQADGDECPRACGAGPLNHNARQQHAREAAV